MNSVDDTIRIIAAHCPALSPQRLPLSRAWRRVLREPVVTPEDIPPFDRSAMDGYAVRRDDPGPRFEVVAEIRPGQQVRLELERGQAVRLFTGTALPGQGLVVVMQEDVELDPTGPSIVVRRRSADPLIRFRGEDVRAGATLLGTGTRLEAGELSLLASLGCATPLVSRPPRIVHFVTGDELVPPDAVPQPGQIRDSNSSLIRAALLARGIEVEQGWLPEDPERAWAGLTAEAVQRADLLLISGGASVGRHDHTGALLERLGHTLHITKVNARPGKPLIFGTRPGQTAFGLPGNPVSHLVCFHLFVAAALRCLEGLPADPPWATGQLAHALADCDNARETLWPARCTMRDGRLRLEARRWQSSGDVTALPGVNALLRVRPNTPALAAGAVVPYLPVGDPAIETDREPTRTQPFP